LSDANSIKVQQREERRKKIDKTGRKRMEDKYQSIRRVQQ
jgi:hypothetical protein